MVRFLATVLTYMVAALFFVFLTFLSILLYKGIEWALQL